MFSSQKAIRLPKGFPKLSELLADYTITTKLTKTPTTLTLEMNAPFLLLPAFWILPIAQSGMSGPGGEIEEGWADEEEEVIIEKKVIIKKKAVVVPVPVKKEEKK